jgi:hypothetical protein
MMGNALRDSSALVGRRSELRDRFREDGCLYLANFLEKEKDQLLEVRAGMVEILADEGLLADGVDRLLARPGSRPALRRAHYTRRMLCLESIYRIWHSPRLLDLAATLLDEPAIPHPTVYPRVFFPGDTGLPPHCDHHGGSGAREFIGVWLAVGDCPKELGPVAYMVGAHRPSRQRTQVTGSGVMSVDHSKFDGEWSAVDVRLGDVLIHHSELPHKGLRNATTDQVRLSIDSHYQRVSEPILSLYTTPFYTGPYGITWEDVYREWRSDELKYYWRRPEVKVASIAEDPCTMQSYEAAIQGAERDDMQSVAMLLTLARHYELPERLKQEAEGIVHDFFARARRRARSDKGA